MALFVSFVINVCVVAVFAHGLFNKQNKDIVSCYFVFKLEILHDVN